MLKNEKITNLEKLEQFQKLNIENIEAVRTGKKAIVVIFNKYERIENILFNDREKEALKMYKMYFNKHFNKNQNIKKIYIKESWSKFLGGEVWEEFGKIEIWAESPHISHDPADYIKYLFIHYLYIGEIEKK